MRVNPIGPPLPLFPAPRVAPPADVPEWCRGLVCKLPAALALTEISIEVATELIGQGKVRSERINGQLQYRVDDLIAGAAALAGKEAPRCE